MTDHRNGDGARPNPPRLAEAGDPALARMLRPLRSVEPPAAASARVWRRLTARDRPVGSGARGLVLAGLAVVALAWGASRVMRPARSEAFATLTRAHGSVEIAPATGVFAIGRQGARLEAESQVRVGSDGEGYVRFADAGVLCTAGTEVTLRRIDGGGIAVALRQGTATAAVAPRRSSAPFVIQAGAVTVRVVGTLFSVALERGSVSVRVAHGTVEVATPDQRFLLHAGESWPRTVAPLDPGQRRQMATAERLLDPRADEDVPEAADRQEAGAAPRPARASSPPREAAVESHAAAGPPATSRPDHPARSWRAEHAARPVRGRADEVANVDRPDTATASSSAEVALYDLGNRQLREGDPRGAARTFGTYLDHYRDGVLVQEASIGLIESYAAVQAYDEARQAIATFLRAFPGSERSEDVQLLQAHVTRAQRGCAAALSDYAALVRGAQRVASEALYFSAICRQQLGHDREARLDLERYHSQFPHGRRRAEVERALGRAP